MKKHFKIIILALCIGFMVLPPRAVNAQLAVLEIIKAGVKKAIKAMDLKIQRLQNKTIWLQNAQKTLENSLSKLKLGEISDWSERQKEQYRLYYEELAKVKSIITYYQRIKDISLKQFKLVEEYKRAWGLFQKDKNFTANELDYMQKVYTGILKESLRNVDQIAIIVKSFSTQMSDAKRIEIIDTAADQVDENFDDLTLFNKQNIILSLQRAKTQHDVDAVKRLYDLP